MAWSATWAAKVGFLSAKSRAARMRGGWGSLGVRSAVERDVEISGGHGRSKPFAFAAMQRDQVFQNPAGIAIRVAFHQIAPHGEPGVA